MTVIEERHETVPELSLWRAVRAAASALSDAFVAFAVGNVVWLAAVGAALLAGRLFAPASVLVLLVVPASHGLCRMATIAVRGRPVRMAHLRVGATGRGWAGFWLGVVQLLLLALAAVNAAVAVHAPNLALVLAGAVSGYAGLFVFASVLVLWPLLLDPDRAELSMCAIARLGFVVIAARPGRVLALVVFESLLVFIGLQTFVAALVLPAFGLLLAAWVVLPLADELESSTRCDGSTHV